MREIALVAVTHGNRFYYRNKWFVKAKVQFMGPDIGYPPVYAIDNSGDCPVIWAIAPDQTVMVEN